MQGTKDGLTATVDLQLGEDTGDVVAYHLLADHEPGGYLPLSHPLRNES